MVAEQLRITKVQSSWYNRHYTYCIIWKLRTLKSWKAARLQKWKRWSIIYAKVLSEVISILKVKFFPFIFVHVTVRIVRLKICVKLFQLLHLKASKEKCSQECEAIQKQVKSKNHKDLKKEITSSKPERESHEVRRRRSLFKKLYQAYVSKLIFKKSVHTIFWL